MQKSYPGLESSNLLVGQSISLSDDWDKVDLGMKPAHNLDIKWLEGVASWLEEVDASVDAVVDDVHAVDLVLGIEVGVEALLDVIDDWSPGLVVVDEVSESRGINNSQAKTDAVLLNIRAERLDGNSLGDDVEAGSLALAWWV